MVGSNSHMSNNLRPLFIVTPCRVENDILNLFLEQETGSKCQTVECIDHIDLEQAENRPLETVILLDCFGKDEKTILTELNSCFEHTSFQHLLGLFNLSPGTGIERETVRLGVKAIFYEDDELNHFLKGIRALCNGEIWLSRKIMAECIEENTGNARKKNLTGKAVHLTRREKEILTMISVGSSNDDIADKLCLSPHTVKTHISSIFKKINVTNRFQAALWAAENL